MKTPLGIDIRKVTKQQNSNRITIPSSINWKDGDQILFTQLNNDTVLMKRLTIEIFDFAMSKEEEERIDKMMNEAYERALQKDDGGIEYYQLSMCETCGNFEGFNGCAYIQQAEGEDKPARLLNAFNKCRIEKGYSGTNKDQMYESLNKQWRW